MASTSSSQLIQLSLPGPKQRIVTTFIPLRATLAQLVHQLLSEDKDDILSTVVAPHERQQAQSQDERERWRIQRCLQLESESQQDEGDDDASSSSSRRSVLERFGHGGE